jgi:hypothetical protein
MRANGIGQEPQALDGEFIFGGSAYGNPIIWTNLAVRV